MAVKVETAPGANRSVSAFSHLFPQSFRHLVDGSAHLTKLPRVFDVGPDAERRQRRPHHQVTHGGDRVDAHEPGDHGRHVHDKHDGEERGGRPRGVEDVLAVVVLAEVGKGLVQFRLQLLLVTAAEILAAHLLHRAEMSHRRLTQLHVAALQLRWWDVGFVPATHLRKRQETEQLQENLKVQKRDAPVWPAHGPDFRVFQKEAEKQF